MYVMKLSLMTNTAIDPLFLLRHGARRQGMKDSMIIMRRKCTNIKQDFGEDRCIEQAAVKEVAQGSDDDRITVWRPLLLSG